MTAVYVSLTIDDLDARNDPTKSDRIAMYDCSPEDREIIFRIIKKYKGEKYQNHVGFPVEERVIELTT